MESTSNAAISTKQSSKDHFRTDVGRKVFHNKYKHELCETWPELAHTTVLDVCQDYIPLSKKKELVNLITKMQFIPAGRYLYYAGRPNKYYNNCYLLRAEEDTREDWSELSWKAQSCLMTGGGIGIDYSVYRPGGIKLSKTGGLSSGPISQMRAINEIGRQVMQGGSRRSAIYASLNWQHADLYDPGRKVGKTFMTIKNWDEMPINGAYADGGKQFTVADAKMRDFNFPAPLDMTNISPNYDNEFLSKIYRINQPSLRKLHHTGRLSIGEHEFTDFKDLPIFDLPEVFIENCRQALRTGEPGFSFNFFDQENETLRNACTEVTSEDDSDVCNLGSLNMAAFDDIQEFRDAVELAIEFLVCGTLRAHLPYDKVKEVRENNRRLGLGLMGVHEWLLKRGYSYSVPEELHDWLTVYKDASDRAARRICDRLGVSHPVAKRAIAPTGSIGMLAGTTTGIEPLFATAFKRRWLEGGDQWKYTYVVEGTAKVLIQDYGLDPENIETSLDLSQDVEKRVKFQYEIQKYVDQSISSTINLPEWGTEDNNEDHVLPFAKLIAKYAHGLRGITCYPDGARGGQPLTCVPYHEAMKYEDAVFEEVVNVCDLNGGGICGD